MLHTTQKASIIGKYATHEGDTGSPEVQIALMSERITYLTEHFKTTKRTTNPAVALKLVSQRRRQLDYLSATNRALPQPHQPPQPAQVALARAPLSAVAPLSSLRRPALAALAHAGNDTTALLCRPAGRHAVVPGHPHATARPRRAGFPWAAGSSTPRGQRRDQHGRLQPACPAIFAGREAHAARCPICGVRYPDRVQVCPRDASELVDIASASRRVVGTHLSQTYSIVRVIGEGGMGRVYEARHTRMATKRFAIKMLHPEFARKRGHLAVPEGGRGGRHHQSPYVVGVYDVDRTAMDALMVGESWRGPSSARASSTAGECRWAGGGVVRQICKALAAAPPRRHPP